MSSAYRIGSLFSGIGGLELGLEHAGAGRVAWQCETDEFCRNILAHHWPDATRYGDVMQLGPGLPYVDILTAGWPCQDLSMAGTGLGLEGAKSGLFYEVVRLVRQLRPRYVVLENVAAITIRWLGPVLGALAELGYDAEWQTISAHSVGAPHKRDRWFLIGWNVADSNGGRFTSIGGEDSIDDGERRDNADRYRPTRSWRSNFPPGPNDLQMWGDVHRDIKPSVCRVAYGFSSWMGSRTRRLAALGNAVVPHCTLAVGTRLLEIDGILKHTASGDRDDTGTAISFR